LYCTQAVLKAGASAAFNSRASTEDQLAEIEKITGGKFSRIVDTSLRAVDLSIKALETISNAPVKYFATVDDWYVHTSSAHSLASFLREHN
jgi:hypothetical protein